MSLERITTVTPQFNGQRLRISFAVRDEKGAIEFWFIAGQTPPFEGERCIWAGGVELHSATPLRYSRDRENPNHSNCALIGRCWHDGSSLYAIETVFPGFMKMGSEYVFELLTQRHKEQFYSEGDET